MPKREQINIRLPKEERDKLNELAEKNNSNASEMIRTLINNAYNSDEVQEHLKETLMEQKAYDALISAGLDPTSYNVQNVSKKKMPSWKHCKAPGEISETIISEDGQSLQEIAEKSLEELWKEFDNEPRIRKENIRAY